MRLRRMGSSVGRSVGAALRAAFGGQTVGRDGLRGGLERIHSDGTVASGWMAPCFRSHCWMQFLLLKGGRKRGGREVSRRFSARALSRRFIGVSPS